jgi:hypothetical protein
MEKEINKFPKDSIEIVNFIWKKGEKNLLCVGINPKNFEPNQNEDFEKMEKIANQNGYDGVFLVYLYPKIEDHTSLLEINADEKLFWENINLINTIILKNQFHFKNVWLNWGCNISSFNQIYLKQSAVYLFQNFEKYKLEYVSIGEDLNGNPISPKETTNQIFQKFDYKNYVKKIKETIKVLPQISLNGYEFK